MLPFLPLLVAACAVSTAAAPHDAAGLPSAHPVVERDGIEYQVFHDPATGAVLEYVTDSGVCETTPGVKQYSGYLSIGKNMNMWFWFFAARNNPATAPISTWFNGGPGCSSMIGLFQENGPCQFYNGSSEPSRNPYSFNDHVNMLYVDQPIGVGFSYGTENVGSTVTAAEGVWVFLQAFYKAFPQYESREFSIATESYGGHYGPEFAAYFESQNAKISKGTITGHKIDLVALAINNGFFDALIQYAAYIDFAYYNSYNRLISKAEYTALYAGYFAHCKPAISKCTSTSAASQNNVCSSSDNYCSNTIFSPIVNGKNFDVYDVREPSNDPFPPSTYNSYLARADIKKRIGARTNYVECSNRVGSHFVPTGDDGRPFLATLSSVVQSGIQVVIYAGDADFICNYMGGFDVVNNVTFAQQAAFRSAPLASYTVNGVKRGLFKTAGNLSWLQVFAAGHEVPYYQPATALQLFTQTIARKPLSPT